jgi:predicted transcriptional regulator
MSAKEAVLEAIKELPDHATYNEILEHVAVLAAIQRGIEAAEAGKVLSHEEVKKRIATWTSQ